MAKNSRSIIVSGAGVAGLTSALCLAKAGFRVSVLERSGRIEEVGAGLQLSPNACQVLADIGLGNQLKFAASAPESIRLFKASNGRQIARVPLGKGMLERYGWPYLVIHRADLCEMLAKECEDHPDIDLLTGHRVIDAVPHANGITAMVFHNERIREFSGRILVAADGVWSKFRTDYIEAKPPVYSGLMAWRALVPGDKISANRFGDTQLWLAPNGHGVTYSIRRDDYLNIVVVVKEPSHEKGWELPANVNELRRRLSKWHPNFTELLQMETKWTKWPLYEAPASKHWALDNLALVGDAAHAMLPFAAQGAAMAIEDAQVLTDKISTMDDTGEALRAYETARMPRVKRTMQLARSNSKIYHANAAMAFSRDVTLKVMPEKMLLSRQDWLYGWRTG